MLSTKMIVGGASAAVVIALICWALVGDRESSGIPSKKVSAAVASKTTKKYTYTLEDQTQAIENEPSPESNANYDGHAMIAFLPIMTSKDLEYMGDTIGFIQDSQLYNELSSGNESAWDQVSQYLQDLPAVVSWLQQDMAESQYVGRINYVNHDLDDMNALADYALDHHDASGAQALKLYDEGYDDLDYYLMNNGEPNCVLTVEGGNAVDNFLQSHGVEVGN
jgi:hypothetical protein